MAKKTIKPGSVRLKNLKHERFCQLFVNGGPDYFNNATMSYAEAFDFEMETLSQGVLVGKKKVRKNVPHDYSGKYAVARSNGNRLLTSADIQQRINFLYAQNFNEDVHDRELQKVITQDEERSAKVSALRLAAQLKGRIIDKTALTNSKGEDLIPDGEGLAVLNDVLTKFVK